MADKEAKEEKKRFWVQMRIEGRHRVLDEDGTPHLFDDAELVAYEKANIRLTTNEFDALKTQQTPQALAKRGGNPLYDAVIADLTKRQGTLEDRVRELEDLLEALTSNKKAS